MSEAATIDVRQLVTQTEYASMRGISKQAVNKIAGTKVPLHKDPRDGRLKLDLAEADRIRGATILRVNSPAAGAGEPDENFGPSPAAAATDGLTKARTATEIYKARHAQLDFDEKVGRLLKRADVDASMRRAGAAIERQVTQLHGRADDLAAAFNREGVPGLRSALRALEREVLEKLESEMRILAAEEIEGDGA